MKLPLSDKKFIFLLVVVVLVVTLEILAVTGIEIPLPYSPFIYGTFTLIIGYRVLWNGIKSLFILDFASINLLMLIAVIAAFYLNEYSETAVVIVLYVLGEKLEDIGIENSMSALDNLVKNSPKTAVLKETGEPIPIEKIAVGTIIQVKPHDMIPLDGIVESGSTSIDESSITGEPIPKVKTIGNSVFAGTLNKNGFVEIKTTKSANDTTFAQIIELTYKAQENKSETQKFIQKFARIYTPIVIVLSVLLFTVPVFILGQDANQWLNQAISILVIACPCALVISTPIAIYAAMGNASTKGILIKGGKYLEALSGIKAIGFDKTRTITYGNPVVSDVIPMNGTDMEELLACGAGTEIFSEHPLAQAIVEYARSQGYEPHVIKHFESIVGKGAKATCMVCDKKTVLVGKLHFIEQYHPVTQKVEETLEQLSNEGKTSVIVSCNNEVKGIIALTDEIKPDSFNTIEQIKNLNIKPVILTGDNKKAGTYVASQVGIDTVFGELLPQDKSNVIQNLLNQYQSVAMVGDGVNDAPALAKATVGIAMGAAGSDTAIEVANVALMNDKLSLLPFLIRLSRNTVSTIRKNTIGAIFIKILFIILAFLGYSNLVIAIAADVGVMLLVVLISLKLISFK
ncbi:MAG: cation-translocating P-type ATPase [Dysgonamonadaceae bacterium]|jgi:Cd2+/Zn2+-exporting ATPase|nr:cation-translocating P-type ATPase [Dysgonamonadaceae bacterium]